MKNNTSLYFKYLIYLLILALVQNFYFFITDYNNLKIKIIYTISTLLFYILLGSINKNILKVILMISFFSACFVFPSLKIYGEIDFSYIASIFYTNTSEAFSYINVIDYTIIIPLVALGCYSIFLIKKIQKIIINTYIKILLAIGLLILPLKNYIAYKLPLWNNYNTYIHIPPINKIVKSMDYYLKIREQDKYIKTESQKPSSRKIIEKNPKTPNKDIVIIVDESIRKDFLHTYGFPINNTPFISKSKNIQFNNYISIYTHTIESLLRTLSLSKNLEDYEINNNIITLGNTLGYETYWISNQWYVGTEDSPISVIGTKANTPLFLNNWSFMGAKNQDIETLPYFNKIIQNNKNPKIIVIHKIGAHPSLEDKTQGLYDEFIISKDLSFYNKIIKNTDLFLKEIYSSLKQNKKDFIMIYLSDHGLEIKKNNALIHGNGYKELYNVPLIIRWNTITKSKKINAIRTGKDFLHLFSEILGVKTKNIPQTYTFISEEKNQDTETQVLGIDENKNIKIVNYEELKDNKVPNIPKKL